MEYPPAPWKIQGRAVLALQLVGTARVRPLIVPELKIISLFPGKTLGGVYLASYQPGSVLEYNELGVIAALVHYSGKIGLWVSHIYVDNAISAAGGREIWGLPKELAEFIWKEDEKCITVYQGEQLLCTFRWGRQLWMWRMRAGLPGYTVLGSHLLFSTGEAVFCLGLSTATLTIPKKSPFAMVGLDRPWLAIHQREMVMVARAPEVVKEIV